MAETLDDFEERLAALGDLVTTERIKSVVDMSMRAVKGMLDARGAERFGNLLPEWMREDWARKPSGIFRGGEEDLVRVLKEQGDYPYRAAAEHDLMAFFGALRESISEKAAHEMRTLLPEANRGLFDHAASCAYDASVKEFL